LVLFFALLSFIYVSWCSLLSLIFHFYFLLGSCFSLALTLAESTFIPWLSFMAFASWFYLLLGSIFYISFFTSSFCLHSSLL
jgi:hypothetical protein